MWSTIFLSVLHLGCTADLLPGELVIPGEIRAELTSPEGIIGFGSDVAIDEFSEAVVAAADESGWAGWPGIDEVWLPSATSMNVWFDAGRPILGAGGFGVLDIESGELLHEIQGARSIKGYNGGWIAALSDRIIDSDGGEWFFDDPRVVDATGNRSATISCDEVECLAFELLDGGQSLFLGESGDGGDIWIDGDTVWWGAPELLNDEAGGRVSSSFGVTVLGIAGSHIGRSIGGAYAAGGINWRVSPRRTLITSLNGGQSLTIDGMSGPGSVAIAGSEDSLVLGVSGWVKDGSNGAVIVIERENIH